METKHNFEELRTTPQKYPKCKYRGTFDASQPPHYGCESRIVLDETEEKSLGQGWRDTPKAEEPEPAPAPAHEVKPKVEEKSEEKPAKHDWRKKDD